MIKGNKIHDDLFDHDTTNITVDDTVSMAEECGVERLGQQIDIFGINPVNQLANVLVQEVQICYPDHLVLLFHMTMLFLL